MREVTMHVKLKETKFEDYFGNRQRIRFETKYINNVKVKNMDGTSPVLTIEGTERLFFFNYNEGFKIKINCPACNRKPTLDTIVRRVFGDLTEHLAVEFFEDKFLDKCSDKYVLVSYK